MTKQRIDIEIQDRVAPSVGTKLVALADGARSADTAIERLKLSLSTLNTTSLDRVANSSARIITAQARQTSAQARLEAAQARAALTNSRIESANARLALSQQRVATETAKTEAVQQRAAASSAKVALTTVQQQQATARLAAEQQRQKVVQATAAAQISAANTKAAISQQQLTTEAARTNLVQAQAAGAATKAATATIQQESAVLRLAAAEDRQAAAARAANSVTRINNQLKQQGNAVTRQSLYQTQNLLYQLNDVVVGLVSGQKPLTVLVQQGSQISTIYGPGKGVLGVFKALGASLATIFVPLAPVIAIVAALGAGFLALNHEIKKVTGTKIQLGDTFKAIFQVAARDIESKLKPAISSIRPLFIYVYAGVKEATKSIINSIVGTFVLGYNFIKIIWNDFPKFLLGRFKDAFNEVLAAIQEFANSSSGLLNKAIQTANSHLGSDKQISLIPTLDFDIDKTKQGVAAAKTLMTDLAESAKSAFATDYVDGFFNDVTKQAEKNRAKRQAEEDAKNHKPTFAKILKEYQVEAEGLRNVGSARERIIAIGEAERKLNRALTADEKKRLGGLVNTIEKLKLINDLNAPLLELKTQQPLLNAAFKEGAISEQQYTQRMIDLRLAALALTNTIDGGLKTGLLTIQRQFTDVSGLASNLIVNSFQSAEDAMVSLFTTGKFGFKEMIDSIRADLARLAIRQAITAPLAGLLGGIGSSALSIGSSFLSSLPSFDVGTSRVPHDMIAQIHKDEIIVPASQANAIRSGQTGSNNQAITFSPQINIDVKGGNGDNSRDMAINMAQLVKVQLEQAMAQFTRQQQKIGGMLRGGIVVQ
jgi:lambda family phage tail tape measure protein